MSVLMQNCKMPKATTNSSAVVLNLNGIPGAILEGCKPAKPAQPRLGGWQQSFIGGRP